jgi:hypothetical protein
MSKFSNTILSHTDQGVSISIIGVNLDTPEKEVLAAHGLYPTLIVSVRAYDQSKCVSAINALFEAIPESPEFNNMKADIKPLKHKGGASCFKQSISLSNIK